MTDVKLVFLCSNTWNYLTVCKKKKKKKKRKEKKIKEKEKKKSSSSFKNVITRMCLRIMYIQYIYKNDLVIK